MAEVAAKVRDWGLWPIIKKRWRAWLRAIHRDIGYLAIGFTVIYAVSGIAQNHIEDWGDVSYSTYEKTFEIPAIAPDVPDAIATKRVSDAAGLGTPSSTYRAGDEIRLEYANGAKAAAIGTELTIQGRERRAFIGWANWLHTARNKAGWKYAADVYAVFLLYLAISGIFMIKGKLGLQWRGALLISAGVAVPVAAVLLSGPSATAVEAAPAASAPAPADAPAPAPEPPPEASEPSGSGLPSGIKFLPPDE